LCVRRKKLAMPLFETTHRLVTVPTHFTSLLFGVSHLLATTQSLCGC
jgi:hypothetical protein